MKQILNFFCTTNRGERLFNHINVSIIGSLVIGMILSMPMFWMKDAYDGTWIDLVAPYFLYPFFLYAVLMLFLFMPYLWHVGTSETYTGNNRKILKGTAIFCSIMPGGCIYSVIADALFIPHGLHNLIGMVFCGVLYLWIVSTLLKKQFTVVQTFIPLA